MAGMYASDYILLLFGIYYHRRQYFKFPDFQDLALKSYFSLLLTM